MASTYTPIASNTLGSAAADITFSSIPGTYTDLVLVLNGGFATNTSDLYIQVGNSTIDTGSNYSNTDLRGNGSAAASSRTSSVAYMRQNQNTVDSPSTWVINVMSYANTNVFKTLLSSFASAGNGVERTVSLWRSTSAITELKVYTSSGNLSSGFTASLYGVKAA